MSHEAPRIDVNRLLADLQISEADFQRVDSLSMPNDGRVPSESVLKISTIQDILRLTKPNNNFNIIGVAGVDSGVGEQPLGRATIDGVLNRMDSGVNIREGIVPGESGGVSWFSIENGIFKIAQPGKLPVAESTTREGVVLFTEGADLSTEFDPGAEYENRAVAAIRIPGHPTIVQVSPSSEAVRFPKDAVIAAHNAEGGFGRHTVVSKLAEMGIVGATRDYKEYSHEELTSDRPGGPLPRRDQMARVMIRALIHLAHQ